MWLTLAFVSAALLGLYDAAKKTALTDNAVLPVLLLNTLFSTLIFLPTILSAEGGWGWFDGTVLASTPGSAHAHGLVVLKSAIVLASWIFGYFGIKHLPITIVGPINATRPVLVLVGALAIFGERLNGLQWTGVALALVSLFLLSRSGRREGIDFTHNVWICCGRGIRRRERTLRPLHHAPVAAPFRAGMVQYLSVRHDGRGGGRHYVHAA